MRKRPYLEMAMKPMMLGNARQASRRYWQIVNHGECRGSRSAAGCPERKGRISRTDCNHRAHCVELNIVNLARGQQTTEVRQKITTTDIPAQVAVSNFDVSADHAGMPDVDAESALDGKRRIS
jgi:hypothetical protein